MPLGWKEELYGYYYTNGGHGVCTKKGLEQPVVLQIHIDRLPLQIIKQICRHLNVTTDYLCKNIDDLSYQIIHLYCKLSSPLNTTVSPFCICMVVMPLASVKAVCVSFIAKALNGSLILSVPPFSA